MAMAGSWDVGEGAAGAARRLTIASEHSISTARHRIVDKAPIAAGALDHTVAGANVMSSVEDRIRSEIEGQPIVLFMKGTPQFPMCGFSSRSVQALKAAGAQLHTVNVLEEPEIRANLPRFSDWPTFPQLFINGELIGGCDITVELSESGELARIVADAQKA
jgi:monothiol glutaredoxin